jgi:hypothetical protein
VTRPTRLNRVLLAVLGLVLLAAGGFALATHFGWLRLLGPASPVVAGTAAPPSWVFYAVAAVAVALGLLNLRWLAAQLARRPRTATWEWPDPGRPGTTRLDAAVATEPLTGEVEAYRGVHSAAATLAGAPREPALHLVVTVEEGVALAGLCDRIGEEAVPRLRGALGLAALPVTVEFRFTSRTGARVG